MAVDYKTPPSVSAYFQNITVRIASLKKDVSKFDLTDLTFWPSPMGQFQLDTVNLTAAIVKANTGLRGISITLDDINTIKDSLMDLFYGIKFVYDHLAQIKGVVYKYDKVDLVTAVLTNLSFALSGLSTTIQVGAGVILGDSVNDIILAIVNYLNFSINYIAPDNPIS